MGVFAAFGFALAQVTNPSQETINQNQPPVSNSENTPYQGEPSLINQPEPQVQPQEKEKESFPKETLLEVQPQETSPEIPLSENTADQKSARQFNLSSPFSYLVYAAVIAIIFFWFKWWRKWGKRKKETELLSEKEIKPPTEAEKSEEKTKPPAEAEKIVCPTCGGSGKITKKRTVSAPCLHCKETGNDICHYCSGTGRDGRGIGVPLEDIENYPKCLYCGGNGFPEVRSRCCMCRGKRKEEYEESYEVTCPTCKGSGWIRNW